MSDDLEREATQEDWDDAMRELSDRLEQSVSPPMSELESLRAVLDGWTAVGRQEEEWRSALATALERLEAAERDAYERGYAQGVMVAENTRIEQEQSALAREEKPHA